MGKKKNIFLLLTGAAITFVMTTTKISADWQEENGKWWYTTPTGYMRDWAYLEESWYCFDENGWMQTGWQQKGADWYYFKDSGEMVTGWQQIGNEDNWFYFEDLGKMRTEDLEQNGVIYHFDSSGKCSNPHEAQSFPLGMWNGNAFTNSLLNLKFTFPENSTIVSKEEMQEFMGESDNIINDGTGLMPPGLTQYSSAFDFWVILNKDKPEEVDFKLVWEDTMLTVGEKMSAETYADAIIEILLEIEIIPDIQYIEKTAVKLGEQSAVKLSIVYPSSMTIYQDYYIIQKENYIAALAITYENKNAEPAIKEILNSVTAVS